MGLQIAFMMVWKILHASLIPNGSPSQTKYLPIQQKPVNRDARGTSLSVQYADVRSIVVRRPAGVQMYLLRANVSMRNVPGSMY